MEISRLAKELVAIASISAGSGIVLHFATPNLFQGEQYLLLGGLLTVGTIITAIELKKRSQRQDYAMQMPLHAVGKVKSPTGNTMNELNRYFVWLEKKLNELIVREGIQCGLVRIKRGPLVITLQLRLINPTQRELQRLMRLGPALAQLLQVETVRIADTAQGILIEVPSPRPLTPNGARLALHTKGLRLAIGVDIAGKPIRVNLFDHGALFWIGPSRRGKTQSMKSSLYALVHQNFEQLQFIIVASPAKVQEDWGVFASLEGCLGIASSKNEVDAAVEWLVQEMNEGNLQRSGKQTLLVIDDLPVLLKALPHLAEGLAEIAGLGAGLGVHLLVGSQGAGSKRTSGGMEIENNITARILYRPSTTRSGSQSAGTNTLSLQHLSSAKGDAIAWIDGHSVRIATAWIADHEIALLPQTKSIQSPWQNNPNQPSEQANFWQNKWKTGWNRSEQPITSTTPQNNPIAHDWQRLDVEQAAEHVPEQAFEQYVSGLAQLSIEELKQQNLAIDAVHFPIPEEQRAIRIAFGYTNSIRKTCFIAYGHYNGKVREYVKAVVDGLHEDGKTQDKDFSTWGEIDELLANDEEEV